VDSDKGDAVNPATSFITSHEWRSSAITRGHPSQAFADGTIYMSSVDCKMELAAAVFLCIIVCL